METLTLDAPVLRDQEDLYLQPDREAEAEQPDEPEELVAEPLTEEQKLRRANIEAVMARVAAGEVVDPATIDPRTHAPELIAQLHQIAKSQHQTLNRL